MKRTFFALLLTLFCVSISAKPVDVATARRVADTYMAAMGMRNTAALVDVTSQTPFTEFYVFTAEEGGFVLVSADDCVVPVLGYSTTSRFETKDMPENILGWLQDYEKEIRYHKSMQDGEVQIGEAAMQWQTLLAGAVPPAPLSTAVSPMLTTTWNQSPYYNNLCPQATSGDRSVTGCVATATAQVMKYYNHPTTGYGSHTYTSDRTNNGVNYNFPNLTANFGATTYQWSNMPNALTGASSATQLNAVATLMYHIGVAVEMSYSPDASGAHNYNTGGTIAPSSQTALMKYFKYRPDMAAIARDDYSDAAFSALLRAELDQQRPILYSGSNVSAGHSFVFDGYNTSGQFHVNWGWGGSNNGYFTMGSLNPGVGGIGGNSSGTYNVNNVALIGIRPNTNWSTTAATTVTATTTGHGSVTGSGSHSFGDTVPMYATANSGYRFNGWTDGSKFNPREIIANGGSYSFTATFAPISGDTLHYCPGNNKLNNYRNTNGTTTWGIKLPASLLDATKYLQSVQLFVAASGTYTMTVYTGSSHSTTAATESVTFSDADLDTWKTIALSNPVAATQDIWIVFSYGGSGYPASYTYGSGAAGSFLWGTSFNDYGQTWAVTAMIKGIFGNGTPDPDPCIIASFPYSENFNDTTANCWSVMDANADGTTWSLMDVTYGYNNSICIGIQYAVNADDWLMAPPMSTSGNYTVSWKARIRSTTYPETYQVLWYDGTDTTQLFQETLTSTTYVDRSTSFSVPANTTGRIVFRYISNDMYYLYLDNIVIAEASVPTQYTITATSNNNAWGTVSGGGTYNAGATATLTATAASGYHFVQWQDGNTANPRTITVSGNATYTATFAQDVVTYTITATSNNNAWGTVSGGGTYNAGATATLTATAASGYHFVQWQDGNTSNPRTVTVSSNATYTATFEADNNCPAISSFPYSESFDVSPACWTIVDANNDASSWSNISYITGNSDTVFPHSGSSMMASFSWNGSAMNANEYLISPQFVLPAGQNITLSWWFRVNASYPQDKLAVRLSTSGNSVANFTVTLVDITPTSTNGSWTQHTIDLSAYAGQSIYLAFYHHDSYDMNYILVDDVQITTATPPTQYTITAVSNNNAWGTVTGGGTYNAGATATLTATAVSGYHFVQWQDGNTANPRTVTVSGNATYVATFEADPPVQYTVTVVSSNPALGTVTGGGTYDEGTTLTITATPAEGCRFLHWQDNNTNSVRI